MLYIFLASWKIIVVTADVFGDLSSNMQEKRKFSCCCVNLILLSRDCRDEEEGDPRVWPHFHEDDILSAAMYPTGLVATSSYDGLVKVWNIESGSVNCRLHAGDYGLERTQSVIPAEVKRLVTHCNSGQWTVNAQTE